MRDKKVNSINDKKASAGVSDFEPLITVTEAARRMGLNEQTLYGWIHEGKFKGLKLGAKAVRIRPETVREFLAKAEERAAA